MKGFVLVEGRMKEKVLLPKVLKKIQGAICPPGTPDSDDPASKS